MINHVIMYTLDFLARHASKGSQPYLVQTAHFLDPTYFFFLNDVPLIHQCFLCLNDETPCLVDNLRNSLDLTTNKEVLHESLSTAE